MTHTTEIMDIQKETDQEKNVLEEQNGENKIFLLIQ